MEASEQIEKFKEFFDTCYRKEMHKCESKGIPSLEVDFSNIIKFDPELADVLLEQPEEVLKAAEIAVADFGFKTDFRVRFFNLPINQLLMIKDIRSSNLGSFVYIEGLVRQSSDVRPQVVSAKFECPSCGNIISILQLDSRFKEPTRCSCGRKGTFKLLSKSLVDAQRLVMEESPDMLEGGEQPKRLSVILKEDLVEPKMEMKTTPGSKIRIAGIIKEVPIILKTGAQSVRFDLIMEANHVEPIEETFEQIVVDEEEEKKIIEFGKDPLIYERLINSIAPSIYGHQKVKEAIVLQMLGGVKKVRGDGTKTRGDMHILLVGDPGAGKSEILQFVSKTAPKGRFVAGKSATSAGITASVVKDEFLRGWALEGGAMVLANKGILCIDEMDKMSVEDTSSLHEGMEQQQISIAKANIQATLRTETTILAAANPKLGRFDPYSPIASQINLPPALINRFDLIFPIRDMPNRDVDERIASHVLKIQQNSGVVTGEIEPRFLRKYFAYARQKVSPTLSDGAVEEIKKFYVELRNKETMGEREIKPIPISARQLEALVRLAEGSARARLAKKVSRNDAKRAIDLLKYCLMQVGFDYETGQIDIDRISTGITASERSKIVVVRDIITELEKKVGRAIPIEDIIAEAKSKNIDEMAVESSIDKLKREGFLFEPRRNVISRL